MSRCFPFPPPGYEKTARRDAQQLASHLLDKEKHKEKKHKKDKKDKEKKEGKEKKDKERSKDKHRDKKDRKEKHKEKKKDKSRDKSRESVEVTERRGEALHDQKVEESSKKSEEIKDPKFREDFVRKVQDGQGTASRSIEIGASNDRSRGGFSASPAVENDRTAVNKMHSNSSIVSRKHDGLGQQGININQHQQKNGTSIRRGENFATSAQRTPDGFVSTSTMEKERITVTRPPSNNESVPRKEGPGQRTGNISIHVQKRTQSPNNEIARREVDRSSPLLSNPANSMHKGNGKVGRSMENIPTPMQRFDSPSRSGATAGIDRGMPRSTIPSPSITIRRPNGMVRPPENLSVSAKKANTGGMSPAMGKEKEHAGRLLQTNNFSGDQKPPSVERASDGRSERMEKIRDGAPDDAKKEDRKSDRHEKKKRKEKDKHKERKKEKEAKKEKEEHNKKEHDKIRENSISYPVDSVQVKPSAPPSASPVGDAKALLPDENLKKRKNHEMNGFLQNHHDMRPTKLPRPALSNNPVENGTASHVAEQLSSVKPDASNIEKAERLHKKEERINGSQEAQRSLVGSGPRDPVAAHQNGTPSRRSPHPDCKYLSQIYSIPEAPQMMEWPEHGGEDWLLDQGSTHTPSRKANPEPEADGALQVWAQALKIDQADVIALPYVIPF